MAVYCASCFTFGNMEELIVNRISEATLKRRNLIYFLARDVEIILEHSIHGHTYNVD